MISSEESRNCLEIDGKYIIISNKLSEYIKKIKIKNKKLIKKFSKKSYKSNENIFLDAKDLLKAIDKESKNFIL